MYGKCVLIHKDTIEKNACLTEFQSLKACFQKVNRLWPLLELKSFLLFFSYNLFITFNLTILIRFGRPENDKL
jgi:hypothetical protein